ncbi:hypothetical protein ACFWP3_36845 [Streptomyces sp. NPDC058525]|uniref:hypothetical protein n=1 Tax=Streptomyces sp. NPDC058525 TaxID=3346538 RepID=UPI003652754B
MRSGAELSGTAVTASIDLAIGCLRQNFRTAPDAAAGWYHSLHDPNPGITASAVGLFTFGLAGGRFERAAEVVGYLTAQQRLSDDGRTGGRPVRTTNGFHTTLNMLALHESGAGGEALANAQRWLIDVQNAQTPGSSPGCTSSAARRSRSTTSR